MSAAAAECWSVTVTVTVAVAVAVTFAVAFAMSGFFSAFVEAVTALAVVAFLVFHLELSWTKGL